MLSELLAELVVLLLPPLLLLQLQLPLLHTDQDECLQNLQQDLVLERSRTLMIFCRFLQVSSRASMVNQV